ncbi:LOW QUALITY PROTEIN: hypothetical protein CVT26_001089 [Gymnopilus dilepis]|uniref:Uncharacterized protein n=1 Tax=Gymnopilus dilepis TaxID=231916 RepID=A0A409X3K5_9AGAR|nr:LOW QUALITY PROTEIN: hypothetical protein CVT26_001089 [Gymnopilus dilepis]
MPQPTTMRLQASTTNSHITRGRDYNERSGLVEGGLAMTLTTRSACPYERRAGVGRAYPQRHPPFSLTG